MRIWDINPTDNTVIDSAGRECPLDPMSQEPKIPGNAMTKAPPDTGEHEAAQASDGTWQVVADWRGHVYWTADGALHEITELGVTPPVEALDEAPAERASTRRARAIAAIDTKAGQVRAAYASDGTLVDAEYEQALASAKAWTEASCPADSVPGDVQAWADATGNSVEWAAQDIIDTAAAWAEVLTAIRRARLGGKEAVRNAEDDADFDAVAAPYIAQLGEIAAAAPADF